MRPFMPILALLCLWAPSVSHAETVDKLAVVIEESLIFTSDIRLEQELAQRDSSKNPFWSPTHTSAEERLIGAVIIKGLAAQIDLYEPSAADLSTRMDALRTHFKNRQAWLFFLSRHGLNEKDLKQVLRNRLMVERFLERNLEAPVEQSDLWLKQCEKLLKDEASNLRIRRIP
jgi:hypothetical protein